MAQNTSKAYCETEMVLVKSELTWEIKNFSYYHHDGVYRNLASETQSCGPHKEYSWYLSIYSQNSCQTPDVIAFHPSDNIGFAKLKFNFVGHDEKKLFSLEEVFKRTVETKPSCKHLFSLDYYKSKLHASNLAEDYLKVICQCTISHRRHSTFIQAGEIEYSRIPTSFARSLSDLCDNTTFSDFTLKVQGRKIPVHKLVLAVSSPVFKSMFEHDCLEKQQSLVAIVDFDAETVVTFLHYIYSHEFPQFSSYQSAVDVYKMADKYAVDDLKELCKARLISILDSTNVEDISKLADQHCDQKLQEEVKTFLRDNPQLFSECDTTFADRLWQKLKPVADFKRFLVSKFRQDDINL